MVELPLNSGETQGPAGTLHELELLHQVRILYDQLPAAQFSQLAAILLVFGLLFKHLPISTLAVWFVFVAIAILARIAIADRYRHAVKTVDTAQYWFNWFLVGTMLYGVLWSATATILVPMESLTLTGLTSLVLCALAAGAVAVSSVSYKVFLTYASSTLWPYAALLITSREDPYQLFGWLMLVYFVVLAVIAANVNQYFTRFIHLQLKKAELEDTVEKELNKRQAVEQALLNNTWSQDLTQRIRTELSVLRDRNSKHAPELESSSEQKAENARIKLAFHHFMENMTRAISEQTRAIRSLLELLKDAPSAKDQQRYVSMIEKVVHDHGALVRNLSDSARIQSGNVALKQDVINLRRLLIYLVEELPPVYKVKDVRIRRRIGPDVPQVIYGDEDRLKQMLWQLLLNAIRSTEHGEVNLAVSGRTAEENTTELLFEVSDSGTGISQETMEKLTGIETSGLDPASGLGIVRNLVSLQGGTVFAERGPDAGSRIGFTLRFPTTT